MKIKSSPSFVITVFFFHAVFSLLCGAAGMPAYIDTQNGVIIGRGEADLGRGVSYETVREIAIEKARKSIKALLERQPMDVDSMELRTIGEYINLNPDKKTILNEFINSIMPVKETTGAGGKMLEITLSIKIEGRNGYKDMLARLGGKDSANAPETTVKTETHVKTESTETTETTGASETKVKSETTETHTKTETLTETDLSDQSAKAKAILKDKLTGRAPEELGKPYAILLLDFDNESGFKGIDPGAVFSEKLQKSFRRDPRFKFLAKEKAEQFLKDNNLTRKDILNADLTERMPIKGIDGLIAGAISKYEPATKKHGIGGTGYLEVMFTLEAGVRILNARNGRWVYFDNISSDVQEKIFSLKSADDADRMVDITNPGNEKGLASRAFTGAVLSCKSTIRSVFPLEGYILKVSDGKIYVSLTTADGVKQGDIFDVFRIGDPLKDPITGEVVDHIRERIGSLEIKDVKDSYAISAATETTSSQIMPGDVISLKK